MGEYRFSIYIQLQIGLAFSYEYGQIIMRIPFLTMHLSTNKWAKGTNF